MRPKSSVLIRQNRAQNRRKKLRRKTIIFSILATLLLGALIFIAQSRFFLVDKVHISGNKIIETGKLEEIAARNMAGDFLFIFPKNNIAWFPKSLIERDIMREFPRIRETIIRRKGMKEIEITVQEYESKYLACEPGEDNIEDKCYFIDSEGYLFAEAPFFSDGVYFRFIDRLSERNLSIGDSLFPGGEFQNMVSLRNAISNLGIETRSMDIKETTFEFVLDNGRTRVIFAPENDFEKISGNLSAALTSKPFIGDMNKILDGLEYFDLRFGNKVYYKFADQTRLE